MTDTSTDIIVVGGGISGLSVAYWLKKMGYSVTLLEREAVAGGYVRSDCVEGYLIEAGPNSTLNQYPEVDELCGDLGLEAERMEGNRDSRRRYLVRRGGLIPLPMGVWSLLTSELWSLGGKVRLLREPFVKRGTDREESVGSFFERRLGREMVDYGIDPFVSGVYAGDPERLCMRSTFPRAYAMERRYGSLLKGALLRGLKGEKREYKGRTFSFKGGMGRLTEALSERLGDSLWTGWRVEEIDYRLGKSSRFRVSGIRDCLTVHCEGEVLILATPAQPAARLVYAFSPPLSDLLQGITYAPIAFVFLGFDRQAVVHPLDGFGCLIPSCEGFELLGSLWNSTLFPNRAPEGCVALTNFLGGARRPKILNSADGELTQRVVGELDRLLGIKAPPRFVRVIRYPEAIPQYSVGHQERLGRMEALLKELPGFFLAGNYLRGVSVADCILQGSLIAKDVDTYFSTGRKNS